MPNAPSADNVTALQSQPLQRHEIVVVGGGAAGLAVAASLLTRKPPADVAVIEPAEEHFYQPGWTMVGAGIFAPESTRRMVADVWPKGARRIKDSVISFDPEADQVVCASGRRIAYKTLVVATGLKLNWSGIEGLEATLGQNGVTSNYRYDLAPYTWQLVQLMRSGTALFTQPAMPIKCAGAPQKAMYLSCDKWRKDRVLDRISVEFLNAGPSLFGVADYVPPLMRYIEGYGINLLFRHTLFGIDGPSRTAYFKAADGDAVVERKFDMIHVVPPQIAPDCVRLSPLANEAGWLDVDQYTLRHNRFRNVFGVGDVIGTTNAKTAAAARKQAPVVAENVLCEGARSEAVYDGYGSCPLTVERGKIILAEFGYGGKRIPTFPSWFIDDLRPSRIAWLLKKDVLPWLYWSVMLRGRELLARPRRRG